MTPDQLLDIQNAVLFAARVTQRVAEAPGASYKAIQLANRCTAALQAATRLAARLPPKDKGRLVALNEQGRRIGETHPRARLSEADIDAMFALRTRGVPVAEIAKQSGVSREYAYRVFRHKARNQLAAAEWKRV